MEKIKLVIWDLDDTFWQGTLSEGGIIPIEDNIKILNELTDRGIINSIVSKNDFNNAKAKLTELNVWDLFVFPHISWLTKGQQVKSIIEKCQLREVNVLFIDDNRLNIEEVKYYNPKINTEYPDFLKSILQHPSFKGKDDKIRSRLNDYKLLERRDIDKQNFSTNNDFLLESNVCIQYVTDLENMEDRVYELIERTNQLNYTKNRISLDQVKETISNPDFKQAVITVNDKYGDYGVVGYYCLNKSTNELAHFIFSCRILGLGVEQKVFADLGFPKLEVVGEVVSSLNLIENPDWIKVEVNSGKKAVNINGKNLKILFKGGCDLLSIPHYLTSRIPKGIEIAEEVNWVATNNFPVHAEHSQILVDSILFDDQTKEYLVNNIPFIDKNVYKTNIFSASYDVLIYSLLMDYTNDLYQHKTMGFKIPYGGYYDSLTDPEKANSNLSKWQKRGIKGGDESFLNYFRENYINIGQITEDSFIENLTFIRNKIPKHIPMIFLNGAEVETRNPLEAASTDRHKLMNIALLKFINGAENCYLVDVRKVIRTESDVTDNIRHYTKSKYLEISEELFQTMNQIENIRGRISGNEIERFVLFAKRKLSQVLKLSKSVISKAV